MEIVLVVAACLAFLFAVVAALNIAGDIQVIIVAVCAIGGLLMLGLASVLAGQKRDRARN